MPLQQETKKYTFSDYLTWPENERWEIIDGVPIMQSAPTWQHQAISRELITQFNAYLKDKPCQVFASPFDLRLPEGNETDDKATFVVQPDITVVCDQGRLKGTGYFGSPTLVIEISSPATVRNDRVWKFNKYEQAGVKEYWIVEPDGKFINVFTLQPDDKYGRPESYTETDIIEVAVFSGFTVELKPIFEAI